MIGLKEIKELCTLHGGNFHGPSIETLSIPESKLPALFKAAIEGHIKDISKDAVAKVRVRNGEWFGFIPVKVLKQGKVEVNDNLYLASPEAKRLQAQVINLCVTVNYCISQIHDSGKLSYIQKLLAKGT